MPRTNVGRGGDDGARWIRSRHGGHGDPDHSHTAAGPFGTARRPRRHGGGPRALPAELRRAPLDRPGHGRPGRARRHRRRRAGRRLRCGRGRRRHGHGERADPVHPHPHHRATGDLRPRRRPRLPRRRRPGQRRRLRRTRRLDHRAPDRSGGFGKPPNTIGGKGYASEGKDYCPGSTRTVAFLTGSPTTDTTAAALEVGARAARIAYLADPTPTAPEPLHSLDGTQHGTFAETRGLIRDPAPGCAPTFSIYTFATPADTGSLVMVIAADTGVAKAVDPDTAKRIFTSIRPYKP
ncbi:hypothetical protein [Nocardia farcinica]|nr:hypothetical protein [Nocardia farcinica]